MKKSTSEIKYRWALWVGLALTVGGLAASWLFFGDNQNIDASFDRLTPRWMNALLICLVAPLLEESAFRLWATGRRWCGIVSLLLATAYVWSVTNLWWAALPVAAAMALCLFVLRNPKMRDIILMLLTSALRRRPQRQLHRRRPRRRAGHAQRLRLRPAGLLPGLQPRLPLGRAAACGQQHGGRRGPGHRDRHLVRHRQHRPLRADAALRRRIRAQPTGRHPGALRAADGFAYNLAWNQQHTDSIDNPLLFHYYDIGRSNKSNYYRMTVVDRRFGTKSDYSPLLEAMRDSNLIHIDTLRLPALRLVVEDSALLMQHAFTGPFEEHPGVNLAEVENACRDRLRIPLIQQQRWDTLYVSTFDEFGPMAYTNTPDSAALMQWLPTRGLRLVPSPGDTITIVQFR